MGVCDISGGGGAPYWGPFYKEILLLGVDFGLYFRKPPSTKRTLRVFMVPLPWYTVGTTVVQGTSSLVAAVFLSAACENHLSCRRRIS